MLIIENEFDLSSFKKKSSDKNTFFSDKKIYD